MDIRTNKIEPNPCSIRCDMAIIREDDDTYSVVVLNLPGTGSCGDTREEAIENAKSAVRETIEAYAEQQKEVPWAAPNQYTDFPENAERKWVLMNV